MTDSTERRSNRVPKSPKSYRTAFARTVRRHAKNAKLEIRGKKTRG